MNSVMPGVRRFFAFARERHLIYLRRLVGEPAPWTEDPILRTYRFTNVFRELDRTTAWFREHIRAPLRASQHVLWATILFRWFNRIETAKALAKVQPAINRGHYPREQMQDYLDELIGWGQPVVTGAYMVKTPARMSKVEGVLWCLDQIHSHCEALAVRMRGGTLRAAHEALTTFPYMGPFMAYEVVTDLRHTALLSSAPDILTWANPGPGAARGLARILEKPLGYFDRHATVDYAHMISVMRQLLDLSCREENWPLVWPAWELREVEHLACEFDKYERARLGEGRPKQLFKPKATGEQQ